MTDPPSATHRDTAEGKASLKELALDTSTVNKRSNEYTGYRFDLFYKDLYTVEPDRSWELFPPHPAIEKTFL